jgi:acid phosphatase
LTFIPNGETITGSLFYTVGGEGGNVTTAMSQQPAAASMTGSILVPHAPLVDSWGWIADQNMGTSSWPAATYTIALNITNPNSAVKIVAVKVYRVDENGGPDDRGLAVIGDLEGLSVPLTTPGVQTFTINGAAQNGNPTDKLAVKFYTATDSDDTQTFSYAAGAGSQSSLTVAPVSAGGTAQIQHITLVIMENHDYGEIIGNSSAPFLNSLASDGALLTNSHAVTHPSEPNYLALFSGSTQGVTDDSCPQTFGAPNLAAELESGGYTFAGYAEDLPPDPLTCHAGSYWRKHVPWVDFSNVPIADTQDYTEPLSSVPANVTMIVPNICDDMHDCDVATGDRWLSANVPSIEAYDNANDGLLIVTFDEGHETADNHIPTIFYGPMVVPGQYSQYVTHYDVLRTIEDNFGLTPLGASAGASGVQGIFR